MASRGATGEGGDDLAETLPAPDPEAATSPEPPQKRRWDASRLPIVDPRGYMVRGEVAHGGNGRVMRADDRYLDRTVALKELLERGGASEERFVREALVTAKLQHPSIVPIYQAGRWPSGEPFYAMKLVSGRSLGDLIDELRTLDERLELLRHVLAVAEAVAYAHSKKIIHRDLKPANVLVGEFGETVVIDWGLAKDLTEEVPSLYPPPLTEAAPSPDAVVTRAEGITLAGSVMGTPAYMPPEQASASPVDARADVYAIGAILYHVLAGRMPYEDSVVGILRAIRAGPPPPLSAQQAGIPRDLVTLVEKAMARDPLARYPTARELAVDLRRFMTGQIVGAHQYSAVELLRRGVRRYRAPLSVAAAALGLLIGLVALGMWRITDERDQARAAQREAARRADELTVMEARASLERDPVRAMALLKGLSPGSARTAATRFIAESAEEQGIARVLRGHAQAVNVIAFSPDGATLASASDDHSVRLWDARPGAAAPMPKVFTAPDELWRVAFSPDGKRIAAAGKDNTVRLWDAASGEQRTLARTKAGIWELAFSPDGSTLAVAGTEHAVELWDMASGARRALEGHSDLVWELAFSPDGATLASAGKDGTVRLWDMRGAAARTLIGHEGDIYALAFSPDGRLLATGGKDRTARLWTLESGEGRVLSGHVDGVFSVAFSPDSKTLASAGKDGSVRLWDVAEAREKQVIAAHEGRVWKLAFSRDGQWLASSGTDRTARLVDLASGESRVLRGFDALVFAVAFSPDSRILAAASHDHTVRLYDLPPRAHQILPSGPGREVAFSPDGTRLCMTGADGAARLFDLVAGGAPLLLAGDTGVPGHMLFSPDGGLVAASFPDGTARVWDLAGRPLRILGTQADAPLAFSPDGARLAYAGRSGDVALTYADAGTAQVFSGHTGAVLALGFSPGGQLLASAGADGTVRLWDVNSGRQRILRGHEGAVRALAFSPDGAMIASGGQDHTIRFWDLASGEGRRVDTGGFGATEVEFTPDSKAVISLDGGWEGGVRVWDAKTGEQRRAFGGHEDAVFQFAVSPDGRRLATASRDRTVRLWDMASGESRILRGHTGAVMGVAFSPDGSRFATVGDAGGVHLWADDLPEDPAALRAVIEAATPEVLDIDRTPGGAP